MNQSKLIISAVVIAIIIIAGIWWAISGRTSDNSIEGVSKLSDVLNTQTEVNKEAVKSDEEQSGPGFFSRVFGGGAEAYRDLNTGFSFKYPKDYLIKEIPAPAEGEARTLLLSKEGKAPSIQVAVSAFDEDIVLTAERIEADAPDFPLKNPQAIDVAGTKGVKFESDAGVNVWFVARGNLFQLTALPAEAGVLEQIVSTFKI